MYTTIHLYSGPRSLSTAMMYSFGERDDTVVYDEPLYASWLSYNQDIFRPYRKELLNSSECDSAKVMLSLLTNHTLNEPIIFAKHIAKQYMYDKLNKTFMNKGDDQNLSVKHVFLIRDPYEMICSWDVKSGVHSEGCSLDATSLPLMLKLFSDLRSGGEAPIVVDSSILKAHPKVMLQHLCMLLGIPFTDKQLAWKKGSKPYDGMWASYWYDTVHQSTGFSSDIGCNGKVMRPLNKEQLEIYRDALPFYEMLRRHAIGHNHLCPNTSNLLLTFPPADDTIIDHGIAMYSDPRNADLLVWVGDRLYPRENAKVSVFDSTVQGGDAVWEGLRVYNGRIFMLEEHINRLLDSSKMLAFKNVPTKDFIINAIVSTLSANRMHNGAHVRLTLSRGCKVTSSMNPKFNIFGCNLIVLPEWKPVGDKTTYDNQSGITLITASNRRNGPQYVDSKIHHCNLINNILPKIQANNANAADALMLDSDGFVSETNATNIFMVKHSLLLTPSADSCLPGITRQVIIDLSKSLSIGVIERRVSLAEFYAADEVFTTGTMGEITPVIMIDGRGIGSDSEGNERIVTKKIQEAFHSLTSCSGYELPFKLD